MNENEKLKETLAIIRLQKRFEDAVELLQCNRTVKSATLPRLRDIITRGLQRISAFFHPGQNLVDMNMLETLSSIRDIDHIDIGDFEYGGELIVITAVLPQTGPSVPKVCASIGGYTDLIYTKDMKCALSSGESVAEAIALAKNEINHRKKVSEMITEIENGSIETVNN